jgi:DNA polymerase I-like protein with 3'-5' exonuclease and polymerase domains
MKAPRVTTIDFETKPIYDRPYYPPEPVGVSIRMPGERKSKYYAWGHPTGNNCSLAQGKRATRAAFTSGPLLFQNGKFDVDVAEVHMGVEAPPALDIHDTLFLIFLHDPHAPTYSLKPSAERILGMPPTEQQDVGMWLVEHQDALRRDGWLPYDEPKITMHNFGKWICLAPGELVGRYADGDVLRTDKLFNRLYPEICDRGMLEAYQREQRLMPIMLQNERDGMKVNVRAMERDFKIYTGDMEKADAWLRRKLKTPNLNIDAAEELADALDKCGIITEWVPTATGKRSVSKKNMTADMFSNAQIAQALGYRERLATCLRMYFSNWLAMARESDGTIHTSWNQVRQSRGGSKDNMGARTGRMSASLFMNVPKDFDDKGDGYVHPAFLEVKRLPLMRTYVMADSPNDWFGRRDFNQQELRILAHFEDGDLMQAYRANPFLDTHRFVQLKIAELLNRDVPRSPVKTLNFGFIYGQGVNSMAEKLATSQSEIQELRNAQLKALPGLPKLSKTTKEIGREGSAICTWGGREYFCEPPGFNKRFKREMTYEYKLLNYLIQGSAADCTKEAIIRYHDHPKKRGRMVVTVHDEIDISADKRIFKEEMLLLRECMMSVEFDVPMLSDAEYGTSWGTLKDLKEPKPDLSKWS